MNDNEHLVESRLSPGIELIHLKGGAGCEGEEILVENGLGNGLRIQILNDDLDAWAAFHIHSPATAELIAAKLLEWSKRIANPPPAA